MGVGVKFEEISDFGSSNTQNQTFGKGVDHDERPVDAPSGGNRDREVPGVRFGTR